MPAGAVLLPLLTATAAPAQSLVEIARQEQARRAAIAPEDRSRVYTNDDLRDSGGLTIGVRPSNGRGRSANWMRGPDAPRMASRRNAWMTTAEPEAGEIPGEDEWRARMTTAQEGRWRAPS